MAPNQLHVRSSFASRSQCTPPPPFAPLSALPFRSILSLCIKTLFLSPLIWCMQACYPEPAISTESSFFFSSARALCLCICLCYSCCCTPGLVVLLALFLIISPSSSADSLFSSSAYTFLEPPKFTDNTLSFIFLFLFPQPKFQHTLACRTATHTSAFASETLPSLTHSSQSCTYLIT